MSQHGPIGRPTRIRTMLAQPKQGPHGDAGPHTFWRQDLQQCHNPVFGCWCCVCSGFMCGCPCHRDKYDKSFQDIKAGSRS